MQKAAAFFQMSLFQPQPSEYRRLPHVLDQEAMKYRLPIFFFALLALCGHALAATTFTITRSTSAGAYTPGQNLDITITLALSTDKQINAAGAEETIPA